MIEPLLYKKLQITRGLSTPLHIQTFNELVDANSCKECKLAYKFYIAQLEENKQQQLFYWNELKNNYENKENLEAIEKVIFQN